MTNFVVVDSDKTEILQKAYDQITQLMEHHLSSVSEEVTEQQLRDFLFFVKCDIGDFIEQLDIIYYKSLSKIRSYDSDIQFIRSSLGKMKTEIEEQINGMGEILDDHQKSIENLFTNQSLMFGLTNMSAVEESVECPEIEEVASMEDISD